MKSNGFTLIEVMIVVAIIGIVVAIALGSREPPIQTRSIPSKPKSTVTIQCVGGYQVFVSDSGHVTQVKDNFNNVATCVE